MKAWIENGQIRDICRGNPDELYHPEVAKLYTANVPDGAANGDGWDGVALTKPVIPYPVDPPAPVAIAPKVSPVEFKLLFSSSERIAIKAARATDPILEDAYEILEDPRLTCVDLSLSSNQNLVDYMTGKGLVTPERAAEIKTGKIL